MVNEGLRETEHNESPTSCGVIERLDDSISWGVAKQTLTPKIFLREADFAPDLDVFEEFPVVTDHQQGPIVPPKSPFQLLD